MSTRAARRRQLLVQPLEASRHRIAAGGALLPPRILRGQARGELALARRFGGRAGLLQRHAEDEMRVAVTGIAADSFAQPVDRRLGILVEPIGVAKIEEQIAVGRIELRRLAEVIGRAARLNRGRAAQFRDADRIRDGRGRRFGLQRPQHLQRIVESLQVHQRQRPAEAAFARVAALGTNRADRHRARAGDRIASECRSQMASRARSNCGAALSGLLEKRQRRRRRLGDEPFDIQLEDLRRRRQAFAGRRRRPTTKRESAARASRTR